jgi:hypothetical protein
MVEDEKTMPNVEDFERSSIFDLCSGGWLRELPLLTNTFEGTFNILKNIFAR